MITDLTKDHPDHTLWRFLLPLFLSVMFQQLYNIADSMIAGRFAGEQALAAVGASYPITIIFMAFAVGSNLGTSVVVSRLFGAKDYKNMKTAVSTSLISCGLLSLALTLFGILTCPLMMRLIHTPSDIFSDGVLYLEIYVYGLAFLIFYNVATGIFTALGDSKTPLYFLIGSSIGNIILDYIFVAEFHMGVAGVAWATFIAQGISAVLAMISLFLRLKTIKCKENSALFSFNILNQIASIAIPSIMQQSVLSVGNLFVQNIVNQFGSSVIAGYSAAIKLNTFAINSFMSLGNCLSSYTAQNLGAKKPERIPMGFRSGIRLSLLAAIPFFVIYFFFGNFIMDMFLKDGSIEALQSGMDFLKIVSPFYFMISIKLMCDGILRGSGAMSYFVMATIPDLILRILIAKILINWFGSTGIWMAWPFGWIIATILTLVFYRDVVRKQRNLYL
ncbi:MAG: MATE family efflux transporter [Eubacteriales bacterium]|nr:MATE family efflux transporter [Eubacteriales bacterium]